MYSLNIISCIRAERVCSSRETEAPRAVFEHSLNTKITTWNRDDSHDCGSAIWKRRFPRVRLIGNYFSRRADTVLLLHTFISLFRFYRNERYVVGSDSAYVSIPVRSLFATCTFLWWYRCETPLINAAIVVTFCLNILRKWKCIVSLKKL